MIRLAGCVIQDDAGAVLLMRRCDKAWAQWESPGGKIEAGESAEVAVIRECVEELGVTVRIDAPLTTTTFDQDGLSFSYEWFLASIVQGSPTLLEPAKHDQLRFVHPTQVDTLGDPISPNLASLLDLNPTLEAVHAA